MSADNITSAKAKLKCLFIKISQNNLYFYGNIVYNRYI